MIQCAWRRALLDARGRVRRDGLDSQLLNEDVEHAIVKVVKSIAIFRAESRR